MFGIGDILNSRSGCSFGQETFSNDQVFPHRFLSWTFFSAALLAREIVLQYETNVLASSLTLRYANCSLERLLVSISLRFLVVSIF